MSRGQLKLFSGSAHPALSAEIAEFLGVSAGHARLQRFPDTEVSFQIDENIRGTDVFIVQPTCSDVDRNIMELCVMIDAFRRSSASRITAVMREADDRRNASIITHSSTRFSSTGAHVGWTMNTSVPRMFSSIWNETSVSGNRCSLA